MDGLDLVSVSFTKGEKWHFELTHAKTFPYDESIIEKLKAAKDVSFAAQKQLDEHFGDWIGEKILAFGLGTAELVAVHGHTLVHKPEEGISWQLGKGDVIANTIKCPTITNFRTQDVLFGGQGAPLVPVGDFELFGDFEACLNLGGIANISIKAIKQAWDVCPCNQVLNYYADKLGKPFDFGGKLAATGEPDKKWYKNISSLPYFHKSPPKSLANEFIDQALLNQIIPINGLRSYTHFVADQVKRDLLPHIAKGSKILTTGGGALNDYLLMCLNENKHQMEFVRPKEELIHFKEAIVFAFLGVLKVLKEENVLASVTGASQNSCSGDIHFPK